MLERREGNHHEAGSATDIGEEDGDMEEERTEDAKEEDKRKKKGAKEDNKGTEDIEEEEEEEEFYSRVFDPQQHIAEEIDGNRISGGVVSGRDSGAGDVNLKGGGGGILRGRTKNRRRKRAPPRHVTLEEEMTGKKLGPRENVSKFYNLLSRKFVSLMAFGIEITKYSSAKSCLISRLNCCFFRFF